MSTEKVSDAVARFLHDHGVGTVFGIIGFANAHLFDSFRLAGVRVFNVHNEQAALQAAGAHFRASGRLAASCVTAGGGASNAVTGAVGLWAFPWIRKITLVPRCCFAAHSLLCALNNEAVARLLRLRYLR